nr:MAG TPA: hypothetical protein [Caudoviricetes sp.]
MDSANIKNKHKLLMDCFNIHIASDLKRGP